MRAIIIATLLSIGFSACTTCIECSYTDNTGNKTQMSEYCGKSREQDKIRRYCRVQADSLGGQCTCK